MLTTAPAFAWTDEKVRELARLYAQSLSMGQIAAALGTSRNAVIGKLHRLRLRATTRKAPKAGAVPAAEAPPGPKQVPVAAEASPISAAPIRKPALRAAPPVPFIKAETGQCRFAVDPRPLPTADMLVCGKPVIDGLSWCEACAGLVFINPPIAVARMKGMSR